ncbi:MAG TPA: hypothetical protein VE504_00750 [Nitrososphaeraceae archaeon]|jgi:hypothetical protein|nr:hypothetical protein [Nitrososphaeraceae archaeon]
MPGVEQQKKVLPLLRIRLKTRLLAIDEVIFQDMDRLYSVMNPRSIRVFELREESQYWTWV